MNLKKIKDSRKVKDNDEDEELWVPFKDLGKYGMEPEPISKKEFMEIAEKFSKRGIPGMGIAAELEKSIELAEGKDLYILGGISFPLVLTKTSEVEIFNDGERWVAANYKD